MRKKGKPRVIWRHPKGRFELREWEVLSLYGDGIYKVRECYMTPRADQRGMLTDEDLVGLPRSSVCRPHFQTTQEEHKRFVAMYMAGSNMEQIGASCGRSATTVANVLKRLGVRAKK